MPTKKKIYNRPGRPVLPEEKKTIGYSVYLTASENEFLVDTFGNLSNALRHLYVIEVEKNPDYEPNKTKPHDIKIFL